MASRDVDLRLDYHKTELANPLRKVWLGTELFLFTFYLAVGIYFSIIDGLYQHVILLRIPFLNYYYPAISGSLIIFGLFGLFLIWRFKTKAIPVFLVSYALFEWLSQVPVYGIVWVIGVLGIIGYLIAKPKIDWKNPLALATIGIALLSAFFFLTYPAFFGIEFMYEAALLVACGVLFKPR